MEFTRNEKKLIIQSLDTKLEIMKPQISEAADSGQDYMLWELLQKENEILEIRQKLAEE
jgi:hypothetical protein